MWKCWIVKGNINISVDYSSSIVVYFFILLFSFEENSDSIIDLFFNTKPFTWNDVKEIRFILSAHLTLFSNLVARNENVYLLLLWALLNGVFDCNLIKKNIVMRIWCNILAIISFYCKYQCCMFDIWLLTLVCFLLLNWLVNQFNFILFFSLSHINMIGDMYDKHICPFHHLIHFSQFQSMNTDVTTVCLFIFCFISESKFWQTSEK